MAMNYIPAHLERLDYKAFMLTGFVTLIGIAIAVFLGLVSGTGNMFIAVILGGIMLAGMVALFPVPLLWIGIIGGLVLAGLARLYLPQFQFVRWLVAGASFLLLIHVVTELFRVSAGQTRTRNFPALVILALLFLAVSAISTFFNRGGLAAFLAGAKNYFQVWPLMFVLALVRWDEKTMLRLPKTILWIALLQLPFVLHQFFFIVPTRVGLGHGIVPVDVVSGTFGGDRMGGGSNAMLSLFLIVVWTGVLARWKYKLVSGRMMLLLSLLLLTPLFLNESKVSIIYLALVFVLLFRDEIVRRPHLFLGGGAVITVVMFGLLTSYVILNYQSRHTDIPTVVEWAIDQNFGERRSRWSRELNRLSVYPFWAERHGLNDIGHTLVGHGLGASKETEGVIETRSLASTRYPGVGIGLTGITSLLWDVGVLGLSVIVAMFWWAYRSAGRLSRHYGAMPERQALFRGLQACIPIAFLSLAHKNFFVFDLPYQTFVLAMLGFIAYWDRHVAAQPAVRTHRI